MAEFPAGGSQSNDTIATLYASLARSLALSAANAVAQQQSGNVLAEAVTAKAASTLLSGQAGVGAAKIADHAAANAQIAEVAGAVAAALGETDRGLMRAAIYQTIAQAIVLGVQNAIAQQQQADILRNALAAAAASAILDGKKDEAGAIEKLAESPIVTPNLAAEIASLLAMLQDLRKVQDGSSAAASGNAGQAAPAG